MRGLGEKAEDGQAYQDMAPTMKDQEKTKEQLIQELEELRLRTSALKASETKHRQTEQSLRESEELLRELATRRVGNHWENSP